MCNSSTGVVERECGTKYKSSALVLPRIGTCAPASHPKRADKSEREDKIPRPEQRGGRDMLVGNRSQGWRCDEACLEREPPRVRAESTGTENISTRANQPTRSLVWLVLLRGRGNGSSAS